MGSFDYVNREREREGNRFECEERDREIGFKLRPKLSNTIFSALGSFEYVNRERGESV